MEVSVLYLPYLYVSFSIYCTYPLKLYIQVHTCWLQMNLRDTWVLLGVLRKNKILWHSFSSWHFSVVFFICSTVAPMCWYMVFTNQSELSVYFLLSYMVLVLGQPIHHVHQFFWQLFVLLHHPELPLSPSFTFSLSLIVWYLWLPCEEVYLEDVLWAFPTTFFCLIL